MSSAAPAPRRDPARRELGSAVLLVLAGAVLLLVSTAGDWVTGVQVRPDPLPPSPVAVSGGEAAGPVRALALVVLAGVPALAATRRTGRVVVGVLLVLAGVAAGAATAQVLGDPGAVVPADAQEVAVSGRPLLALAGAAVTAVAGAVVAVRGRRWAALSRRYDAPSADGPAPSAGRAGPVEGPEMWDALDRGEDPTRG
jgi:uncharacterized membrane protein (TIGR02234 family)